MAWPQLSPGTMSASSEPPLDGHRLAARIDHTVLRPEARRADIERACAVARDLGCAGLCVNPIHVALASRLLEGSSVKVVAVVGFPFGATYTAVKAREADLAVRDGADEIDMVLDIGSLRDGDLEAVETDIATVVQAAAGRPVKVVLECGLLTDDEKRQAVGLAAKAGAAFVKTSTGFLGSGATIHDVRLLRQAAETTSIAIKATGGIRLFEDAVALIEAGASRLGTSRTEALLASRLG
ncbi:MAG TPA: deoxyribose-phosphate aldolase [Candidatus Limnocylindrales bacterium]|nr:deoxyribose-phosphate aldolase [Candidatus Limnocylindrales bacterium]